MFDIQKKSVDSCKQLIANLGIFPFLTILFGRFGLTRSNQGLNIDCINVYLKGRFQLWRLQVLKTVSQ